MNLKAIGFPPAGYLNLVQTKRGQNKVSSKTSLFLLIAALCFAINLQAATQSVTLAWDPNSEADLTGYRFYYSETSQIIPTNIEVGNVTNYTVSGLDEGKTYSFHVTANNASGLESDSSNLINYTVTVLGAPSGQIVVLPFEGESTTLTTPMTIFSDPLASQGQYIASTTDLSGTAAYSFDVPVSGNYFVWCRILAPDSSRDSFFVSMDGGGEDIYLVAQNAVWQWTRINGYNSQANPRIFVLAAGNHTLVFRAREMDTKLDRVIITNDPDYVASDSAPITVNNSSLVAGYAFNEGSGTTVRDVSGYGNTGTINGAAWITGQFGNALQFNGTGALVTVNDSASLDLTTAMTLQAWVYPTSTAALWRDVIYKGSNDIYYLEGSSPLGGVPAMGGTFSSPLYGTTALPLNIWSHLAATYDGATIRLYVNGMQVASRAQSGPIATSTGALTIGGDTIYGQYWAGRIDEVRIYNRALSASEIQTDMNTPIGRPVADNKLISMLEDSAVDLILSGSDPEGNPLTYVIVSGPTKGLLSGAAPNLRYLPNANFNGADSFTFKVNDGSLDSATATVNITVAPVKDPPVALNSWLTTTEGLPVAITLSGSDPDGEVLSFTIVSGPLNGTLSGTAPVLTYTPKLSFYGKDSFSFKASDGKLEFSLATVTISVTQVNKAPVVSAGPNQTITLPSSASLSATVSDDGLPSPPGAVTVSWSKVSGPGSVTFSNRDAHTTTASFSMDGTYLLRITANDASLLGTSDLTVIVLGAPSGQIVLLLFEAESGALTTPMTIFSDPLASQGQYIASTTDLSGTAAYSFDVPEAGNYLVWCRILAPDSSRDSFFISMDGGGEDIYLVPQNSGWQWSRVNGFNNQANPRIFVLAAGNHTLVFRAREMDTKLDRVIVTNDPDYIPDSTLSHPSLVAAYAFNEGSGTTVGDASGNGNRGTINGAAWTTGQFGNALQFSGAGELVTVNDSASLDLTTGMTLEAWVYPNSTVALWRDVIYKGSNDIYYLEGSSPLGGAPAMGGTFSSPLYGTAAQPLNTWSHLAATYDGATMRLYVNGVQVASRAQSGPIATSTGALTIGGDTIYGQYWAGRIDEVRIYNRALSESEIQSDMNSPIP